MTLDINFANKCYEQWRWHTGKEGPGYHDLIRRGNVRWININMESQANDARQRAGEVRSLTRIRVRHMLHTPPGSDKNTDDGMWRLPVDEWINNIVLAHNYQNTGWFVLDSNEFSTEDPTILKRYLDTRLEIIQRGQGKSIKLALFSTPSHWPAFSENPTVKKWLENGAFDALFKAIAEHQGPVSDPQIIVCPNAYYNEKNDDGLRNVVAIWERFLKVTRKQPHMVLGEFAYARPLDQFGRVDPHGGYLAVNMPPADMIADMVGRVQKFLLSRGIRAMAYCEGYIGGNEVLTFNFGQKTLAALMDAAVKLEAPPVEPEPETPEPPQNARATQDVKIRNKAIDGDPVGVALAGQIVTITENVAGIGRVDEWLKIRTERGIEGYSAAWFFKLVASEEPPKPEPEEPLYMTRAEVDALIAAAIDKQRREFMEYLSAFSETAPEATLQLMLKRLATHKPETLKMTG